MASSSKGRYKKVAPPKTLATASYFRSSEHKERHDHAVLGRSLVRERSFAFEPNEFSEITQQIEKRGWAKLCNPSTKAYIQLVQEFYANTFRTYIDTFQKLQTEVRKVQVTFTPKDVCEYLDIEYMYSKEWDFELMWKKKLWDPSRVLTDIDVPNTKWGIERYKNSSINPSQLKPVT